MVQNEHGQNLLFVDETYIEGVEKPVQDLGEFAKYVVAPYFNKRGKFFYCLGHFVDGVPFADNPFAIMVTEFGSTATMGVVGGYPVERAYCYPDSLWEDIVVCKIGVPVDVFKDPEQLTMYWSRIINDERNNRKK